MRRQRYFQWINGDNKGTVCVLDYIIQIDGELYYQFTDGERCNIEFISQMTDNVSNLRGKLMVEIDSLTNPWEFYTVESKIYKDQSMTDEEENEIPTLHDILQAHGQSSEVTNSDLGTEKIRAPKRKQNIVPLPNPDDYPAPEPKAPAVQVPAKTEEDNYIPTVQTTDDYVPEESFSSSSIAYSGYQQPDPITTDPIKIFVDSCKKHETEVELSITVDLPSADLYKIAKSEFEDGGDKFVDYIIQDLDINGIISSLRDALKSSYEDKVAEKIGDK
jgi:hypothetical protein